MANNKSVFNTFLSHYESDLEKGFLFLQEESKRLLNTPEFKIFQIDPSDTRIVCDGFFTCSIAAKISFYLHLKDNYFLILHERNKTVSEIHEKEVTKIEAFTFLNLFLEIGTCRKNERTKDKYSFPYPEFNEYSLKASQRVLNYIKSVSTETRYANGILINRLFNFELDLLYFESMMDSVLYSDYMFEDHKVELGCLIVQSQNIEAELLRKRKLAIKRIWISKHFDEIVASQKHFTKNDSIYKTNQGFPGIIHSSGLTVTDQTPGVASIQVPDDKMFDDHSKLAGFQGKALFHYYYRHYLPDWFTPNDLIDIESVLLRIDGSLVVKVIDIFRIISALHSLFQVNVSYSNPFQKISYLRNAWLKSFPFQIEEQRNLDHIDNIIITHYNDITEKIKFESFIELLTQDQLVGICRNIEELGNYSNYEITKMIDFIANHPKIPVPIIFKSEGNYLFSVSSHSRFNFNKVFYDHCITDSLFSNKSKDPENIERSKRAKNRESMVCEEIRKSFKRDSMKVVKNWEYPDETGYLGQIKGEIDEIIYSKQEKLLLFIQLKLSNTYSDSYFGRWRWLNTHILTKAKKQMYDAECMLSTPEGLKQLSARLGYKQKQIDYSKGFHQLVVTDNFYYDHNIVKYNEEHDKEAIVVSLFEMDCLINRRDIFKEGTEEWKKYHLHYIRKMKPELIIPDSSLSEEVVNFIKVNKYDFWQSSRLSILRLIEIIENKTFWSFLEEFPAFSDEYKIASISNSDNTRIVFKY